MRQVRQTFGHPQNYREGFCFSPAFESLSPRIVPPYYSTVITTIFMKASPMLSDETVESSAIVKWIIRR